MVARTVEVDNVTLVRIFIDRRSQFNVFGRIAGKLSSLRNYAQERAVAQMNPDDTRIATPHSASKRKRLSSSHPDIITLLQHPDVLGLTIFTRPGYTPAKLDIHSLYNPSSADRSRCSELSPTYLHIWNHNCHPQIPQ